MKPLEHHVQRLAARMLQATQLIDRSQAAHIVHKAEKHAKKIEAWHHKLEDAGLHHDPIDLHNPE